VSHFKLLSAFLFVVVIVLLGIIFLPDYGLRDKLEEAKIESEVGERKLKDTFERIQELENIKDSLLSAEVKIDTVIVETKIYYEKKYNAIRDAEADSALDVARSLLNSFEIPD
jgi:hypothetical protein